MKERILTKNFCFSFLALFSISMVMYMLMATVTQYATQFGATATLAGLVSGMYVVGGMFSRVASGKALERLGWKRMALLATALHFVACCFYMVVDNLTVFLIVRFIHGLGFGAATCAIVTIGMSILPKSRLGEAGGYFMMGTTLSVGIGPFVGGYVYDTFGAPGCFLCASVLSFLTGFFLLFVDLSGVEDAGSTPKTERAHTSFLRNFIEPGAIPLSMVTAFTALGYVGVMSFYRIYAEQTDLVAEFSYFFLIYAALLVICRPMAGKIQDHRGTRYVCIPGILAQTAGLFLLSLHPCIPTLILCAAGCAMGYGALTSACNVAVCQKTSLARRSYAVTTFYLCCDLSMGFGPALLGAIVTGGGYHIMYYASAFFTLLALPLFLLIDKAPLKEAVPERAA